MTEWPPVRHWWGCALERGREATDGGGGGSRRGGGGRRAGELSEHCKPIESKMHIFFFTFCLSFISQIFKIWDLNLLNRKRKSNPTFTQPWSQQLVRICTKVSICNWTPQCHTHKLPKTTHFVYVQDFYQSPHFWVEYFMCFFNPPWLPVLTKWDWLLVPDIDSRHEPAGRGNCIMISKWSATVQKKLLKILSMCLLLPHSIFLGLLINKRRDHRCAILNIFHHTLNNNPRMVNQNYTKLWDVGYPSTTRDEVHFPPNASNIIQIREGVQKKS